MGKPKERPLPSFPPARFRVASAGRGRCVPTRHVHTVSGPADESGGLTPRETLSHRPPEPTTTPAPSPRLAAALGGSQANCPLPARPRSCSPRRTPQQPPLAAKQKGSWDLHFASTEPVISPTQPPPQAPGRAASGDDLSYTCWPSKQKKESIKTPGRGAGGAPT